MVVSIGRSATRDSNGSSDDDCAQPPWTTAHGLATADDGRNYSWSIVTTADLSRSGNHPAGADGLQALPDLGGPPLWLSQGDEPMVVVDASQFGPELLDLVQYGPAWLRARVFIPQLTDAEQEWLDALEEHGWPAD